MILEIAIAFNYDIFRVWSYCGFKWIRGTDHGSVAPILMFGNNRSTTTGSNPVIDAAMEWQDNLPMEIDFESV